MPYEPFDPTVHKGERTTVSLRFFQLIEREQFIRVGDIWFSPQKRWKIISIDNDVAVVEEL